MVVCRVEVNKLVYLNSYKHCPANSPINLKLNIS